MRHGQSQNNAGEASSHNVSLTALGREQVSRAADVLSKYQFEALYCSPLERALQSAGILYSKLGIPPYVHPSFSETGFSWGEEDATREELQAAYPGFILDDSITNNGWAPADRETRDEAHERACNIFDWLSKRHPEPESEILVVSHGSYGAVFIGAMLGIPAGEHTRFSQHNAGISRIDIMDIEDGQSKLRFLNANAHLPENMLT